MDEKGFTPGKVLAKNTLLNLLGMVIPIVVGIVAIPFAVKGLGPEGFGIFSIAWVILGYLGLLDFGLSRATTKFVAEILRQEKVKSLTSFIWTGIVVSFTFGVVGAMMLLMATPYLVESLLKIPTNFIEQTKVAFYFLSFSLPFILLSTSFKGILGAVQRFDLVNAVHIPTSVLSFLFPALSLPFGFTLSTVILFVVLSRVSASFVYFFLCFKAIPNITTKPIIDLKILMKLLSYGGWITVTGIISPILVYMDRFFIGSILSMKAVAFYSAPYEAITRLRIVPVAIMTAFFPEFSAVSSRNRGRLEMLVGRSIKYVLISTGVVALLLLCYSHDILQLWLGNQFAEKSTLIFQILALGIVVNCLAYIPFTLFQGVGRPDLPAKFHLVELPFYLVTLWLLTKTIGIVGAATAWFIRVTVDFFLLYFWSYKSYPNVAHVLRENKICHEILLLVGFGAFLFLSHVLLGSVLAKAVLLSVYLATFSLVVWYHIFDNSERIFLTSSFKKLLSLRAAGNA